jgi:hypothetical protein
MATILFLFWAARLPAVAVGLYAVLASLVPLLSLPRMRIATSEYQGSNHSVGTSIFENANSFLPKSFKEAPM